MVNELVSTVTGVIAGDDITVNLATEMQIVSGSDEKKLGEISFKRKNETKNLTMRKSVKVGETAVQM